MTYLEERLKKFMIEECNSVKIGIPYELYDHEQPDVKTGWFESDNDDNIIIHYKRSKHILFFFLSVVNFMTREIIFEICFKIIKI